MRVLENLSPRHLELRRSIEAALDEVSPRERMLRLDRDKTFDREARDRLAQLGVWGLGTPEALGGRGGDTVDQVVALEVLGRKHASMAVYGVVSCLVTRMLRDFGSEQLQDDWLRPMLAGTKQGAFCLTEEAGGTDILANTKTVATRDGGKWVINGDKTWVAGAATCDVMLVTARTAEHRSRGLTVFAVPAKAAGVTSAQLGTIAINGMPCHSIHLEKVVVDESAVVGRVNNGLQQLMSALNGERINAAAVTNGVARGAIDAAVARVKGRPAFGKPIGQFQAVQHRLAACAVQAELAWSAVLEAARQDAAGVTTDVLSGLAKWASSKASLAATDVGMEVMAAAGFLENEIMQQYFRDARLHVFAPVNNDMVLNLLAERWLDLPRSY
jgi:acyl-CoA dehydrogenase